VNDFFRLNCAELIRADYCRVFVLPNPQKSSQVWGFYTLSPSGLGRKNITGSDQKRTPGGLPVPLILVGFMGKHLDAPAEFGESVIIDAARRASRNPDIPSWGLILESDGGQENGKLWKWYQDQGFTPTKDPEYPRLMYASYKRLLPEWQTA
jgi:hypothetical protein